MLAHGLVSPIIFLRAGDTLDQQRTKNTVTAKSAKASSSQNVLWIFVIARNIRTPPTLRFIIEIEILISISKKKANALLALSIITISVLCMIMATNFLQGNTKAKKTKKLNAIAQTTTTVVIVMVIATTATSSKLASNLKKACEAQV